MRRGPNSSSSPCVPCSEPPNAPTSWPMIEDARIAPHLLRDRLDDRLGLGQAARRLAGWRRETVTRTPRRAQARPGRRRAAPRARPAPSATSCLDLGSQALAASARPASPRASSALGLAARADRATPSGPGRGGRSPRRRPSGRAGARSAPRSGVGPSPRARPRDRLADGRPHRLDVVAVHHHAGDAVAGRAVHDRRRQVARRRLGDRPAVVLADVDDRQPPAGRQVDVLVEVAAIGRAVAEGADADAVRALLPGTPAPRRSPSRAWCRGRRPPRARCPARTGR